MELKKKKTDEFEAIVPHWKIFPGRVTFCCDGRLHTSKNWLMIPFVLSLIVVPTGLHLGFDGVYLTEQATVAVPLLGAFILVLTIINYLITAFMDPGYLPRNTPEEIIKLEKENNITVDLSGAYYPTPKNKTVNVKGCDYDSKFCTTCKFYRPPRAVHCSTCNMCVERFDHHCPFVSNCVGKRNYRFFYLFLVFGSLLCLYGTAASAAAFGLRIRDIQPVGKAFEYSVVSILVGVLSFFLGLNLIGMAGAHTSFTCFEKTTNERIKSRYKNKNNELINLFGQKNMLMNFIYVLCGPISPQTINYRAKLPHDYYTKMELTTKELRMKKDQTNKNFVPIPSLYFFQEILKRFDNRQEKFYDEFEFLTAKYLKQHENPKHMADMVINESNLGNKITNELMKDQRIQFFYQGYENAKRYLNINLDQTKPSAYWEFVYEYKINNILLLEDATIQSNPAYEFLLNQQTSYFSEVGLSVEFNSMFRYTNFDMLVFHISSTKSTENEQNKTTNHVIRVYKYWAYDPINNIPIESAFFIKMIRTINFFNPVYKKLNNRFNRIGYPKEGVDIASYLLHSDNPLKLFTFIIYDHTGDEFRLTDRFCIENTFKHLKNDTLQKNNQFEKRLKSGMDLTIDNYIFTYINSQNIMNTNNDITLSEFEHHYKNLIKIGFVSKKAIINDHFTNMLRNAYTDRQLRSAFMNKTGADMPKNMYRYNLYGYYDITGIVCKHEDQNELTDFVIQNRIGDIISINQGDDDMMLRANGIQTTHVNEAKYKKYTDMTVREISYRLNNLNHDLKLTHSVLENFTLNIVQTSEGLEYAKETVDAISWLMMKIFNSKKFTSNKRIVVVCDNERLAAIFLITLINYCQAKQEDTMNISMSTQTVLSKLPFENTNYLPNLTEMHLNNNHEAFFKSFFEIVEFKLVYQVAVSLSQKLEILKDQSKKESLVTSV